MGSAVELHAAFVAGRRIIVIAPGSMARNWVVRSYADEIFEDISALRGWLRAQPQPLRRPNAALDGGCAGSITFLYSRDPQGDSKAFYSRGLRLPVRAIFRFVDPAAYSGSS